MGRTAKYLVDFEDDPDLLLDLGFERKNPPRADLVQWARYFKVVESEESQLKIVISIEFGQGVSFEGDQPDDETYSYSFQDVIIEVYDRQMDSEDDIEFDATTENPRRVGAARLGLSTLMEVEQLLKLLRFSTDDPTYPVE